MPVGTYDTATLNRVVEDLEEPASFLLDTFFPSVQTEANSEEIHFDIDKSRPRLAPFVSPLVAGQIVADQGFETQSFKPAYVKDKRVLKPNAPLKRAIGEKLTGELTPMQRRLLQLGRSMEDQRVMLNRREEVMASEALRLSRVTVSGEKYPTVVVDFKRDAALAIALLGAAQWGEAGVSPLDNLETWAALVQTKSGTAPRTVVFDPEAWKIFRKDPEVKELLDIRRGSAASVELGPQSRGQGNEKARFVGTIGDFDFWVYQDIYIDDAGAETQMLPDHTVLLGSKPDADGRGGVEGVRAYGTIQDEEAGYMAPRFFTKSWLEKDPAVRWLLMQSAPLIVPYRPNAVLAATVRSA